jgi:hypothetical protein
MGMTPEIAVARERRGLDGTRGSVTQGIDADGADLSKVPTAAIRTSRRSRIGPGLKTARRVPEGA